MTIGSMKCCAAGGLVGTTGATAAGAGQDGNGTAMDGPAGV